MTVVESSRRLDQISDKKKPPQLAHFVLVSSQMSKMVDWYKATLNAREVFRNDELCFLTYDNEHHRLAIRQKDGLKKPGPDICGMSHIAYSVSSLGELLAKFVRLRDIGITPNRSINHGQTTSFYYFDPDGNNIEFQTDNFDSVEEAHAFMASDVFLQNPRGIPFDPDGLIRDFERGVPEKELKIRPDAR